MGADLKGMGSGLSEIRAGGAARLVACGAAARGGADVDAGAGEADDLVCGLREGRASGPLRRCGALGDVAGEVIGGEERARTARAAASAFDAGEALAVVRAAVPHAAA